MGSDLVREIVEEVSFLLKIGLLLVTFFAKKGLLFGLLFGNFWSPEVLGTLVMVHKLQQNWDCDMLQQVHFSKKEIRNIFRNKCNYCIKPRKTEAVASVTPDRRTLRAKLLQTSTEKPIGYIDGDNLENHWALVPIYLSLKMIHIGG